MSLASGCGSVAVCNDVRAFVNKLDKTLSREETIEAILGHVQKIKEAADSGWY